MAKGQAKQEITQAILQSFGDKAFLCNDGKEIRINWIEDGAAVQIKAVLTTSKAIVEQSAAAPAKETPVVEFGNTVPAPTAQEKHSVQELMAQLGL